MTVSSVAVSPPATRCNRSFSVFGSRAAMSHDFAAVLVREVFDRSFDNRRQLASYVGITPMPYQSGGMDRDRSIIAIDGRVFPNLAVFGSGLQSRSLDPRQPHPVAVA